MDNTFESIASGFNTEELITAIISMQFYGKNELRDSVYLASEVFASNAIRYNNVTNHVGLREHKLLAKLAKGVLNAPSINSIISQAIALSKKNATEQEKQEFEQSSMMKLKGLVFRGDGYSHQLLDVAERLYRPFDSVLLQKFGFTFSCTESVILYIIQTYTANVLKAYSKLSPIDCFKCLGARILRKDSYVYIAARITNEFRIYKSELYKLYPKAEIDCLLKELAIKPNKTSYGIIDLEDFKPLYAKPFVDFWEYIYLPLPDATILNLPKLFHYYFIADNVFSDEIKGSYNNHRGDVVEKLTEGCMLRLFTKSNIYCSLKYHQKQKTYEADVTVVDTDATIFAECKAKILVTASLNGNIHAIKDDIYKAIGKAYEQAIRTIKHVHAGKTFYNPKDDKELLIQCTPTNYILCVNIEHFGFVPSEIKKYITIDRTIPIVPIAINIYDLDVITQECKCAEDFLQYLDFRVKNADSLMSLDELESFGYFRRFGNVMIPLEGAGTLLPLGLMEEIDGKFMPIASKTVLSKSTEYAP